MEPKKRMPPRPRGQADCQLISKTIIPPSVPFVKSMLREGGRYYAN